MEKRKLRTANEQDQFQSPLTAQISSNWDWDRPFTNEELEAIDAVLAAVTPSSSSCAATPPDLSSGAADASEIQPRTRRRLPGSICPKPDSRGKNPNEQLGQWQRSRSFVPSPCPKNWVSCHATLEMEYPTFNFRGRIIYSSTPKEVEEAVSQILKSADATKQETGQAILGVDIEWKPTFTRGVPPGKAAVVQICGEKTHCHVIHIIRSGIPKSLRVLLEDPTIIKVGVNIDGDSVKLFHDYNVSIKPIEDLSDLANQKLAAGPKNWSLSSLVETLSFKQLLKPRKIRLGNWEVPRLSKAQLAYAATDAFASWYIYEELKSRPDLETETTDTADS